MTVQETANQFNKTLREALNHFIIAFDSMDFKTDERGVYVDDSDMALFLEAYWTIRPYKESLIRNPSVSFTVKELLEVSENFLTKHCNCGVRCPHQLGNQFLAKKKYESDINNPTVGIA